MSLAKTVLKKKKLGRKCLATCSTCAEFMGITKLGDFGQLLGFCGPVLLERVGVKCFFSQLAQQMLTVARQPHSSPAQHSTQNAFSHIYHCWVGHMAQNASRVDRYQST